MVTGGESAEHTTGANNVSRADEARLSVNVTGLKANVQEECSSPTITPLKSLLHSESSSESLDGPFSLSQGTCQSAPAPLGYLSNRRHALHNSFSTPSSSQVFGYESPSL